VIDEQTMDGLDEDKREFSTMDLQHKDSKNR
jgi:hypothetical protein